jgi:hypothetical protein
MTEEEEYIGIAGELTFKEVVEKDIMRIHEVFNVWNQDMKVTIRGLEKRIEELEIRLKDTVKHLRAQGLW